MSSMAAARRSRRYSSNPKRRTAARCWRCIPTATSFRSPWAPRSAASTCWPDSSKHARATPRSSPQRRPALRRWLAWRRATPPIDARIERVLQELRARFAQPVSLAEAARWAHLSPSRFRHLFADQVGASFRAYLLWLRINAAVEHAMAGATWTEAAHFAGFADSSHLSRTFRRMFGFVPVMLVRE